MTVGELMKILERYDSGLPVLLQVDTADTQRGYVTVGLVTNGVFLRDKRDPEQSVSSWYIQGVRLLGERS